MNPRLIAVLLLRNGFLVRSSGFARHRVIGDPIHQCERFNAWPLDELIYVDISQTSAQQLPYRKDLGGVGPLSGMDVLKAVAGTCLLPLTWGGGIRDFDTAARIIEGGADRVLVTSMLASDPAGVQRIAEVFGNQAVLAGIDYREGGEGERKVVVESATKVISESVRSWVRRASDVGAGEILLHAVDRDGHATGYDLEIVKEIYDVTESPVVLLGGAGSSADIELGIQAGATGLAAANYWHFTEGVAARARSELNAKGIATRRL